MENLEEKTITEETLFKGRIIELKLAKVALPNGKTATRELVHHPGAVAIIPVTSDHKLILVEQFRKPLEKTIVEIPAGKIEPGEDHALTARRELEEETGFASGAFEYLTAFYTSPGFADELLHIYLAKDLYRPKKTRALDEDEFINVLTVSLDEAKQLMENQVIIDAKTIFAIQHLEMSLLQAKLEEG
ncbi:NUDIX domain-containing protein [Listeria ilorinensis]|uniref:NUDIX domain-containing protein n=1 Tax=Listeria ilorinensis TaxID=2867439 RepID=UPI001EF52F58|nr:NUDIX hydrolase [Listeria ilorinensis]